METQDQRRSLLNQSTFRNVRNLRLHLSCLPAGALHSLYVLPTCRDDVLRAAWSLPPVNQGLTVYSLNQPTFLNTRNLQPHLSCLPAGALHSLYALPTCRDDALRAVWSLLSLIRSSHSTNFRSPWKPHARFVLSSDKRGSTYSSVAPRPSPRNTSTHTNKSPTKALPQRCTGD